MPFRKSLLFVVVLGLFAGLVPVAHSVPQSANGGALERVDPLIKNEVLHLDRPGTVHLEWPATHAVWSWTGPEGAGVRFRVLRPGDAAWSPWDRAPGAHDLEEGNRHHSGLLAVDGAIALAWDSLPGKPRARKVTLDYIDASEGPHGSPLMPTAENADGSPSIVTRAEWGADESLKSTSGDCKRRFYPMQQLFVHHTAGLNFDNDPYATMRAIYWYHTQRQGWCDLGYNFVIAWDGTIFEGRWARDYGPWETHSSEARNGYAVAGAHVSGFNSGSVGISLMGNFQGVDAPPEMRRSLAELLAWEADRHGLDPTARHVFRDPDDGDRARLPVVAGHRDAGSTACPGDRVYRALPEIRRDAAAAVEATKTGSVLVAQASTDAVTHGQSMTVSGRLTDENAGPLILKTVNVYERVGGGAWALARELTTGPDGSFSFDASPTANLEIVVTYPGDDAMWGSQSNLIAVGVRPVVTLEGEGGSTEADGTFHYPTGTPVVPLAGSVEPAHPNASVVVRIGQVHEDGTRTPLVKARIRMDSQGSYRYEFASPIPTSGVRFRAMTWWSGDADHKPAGSSPIFFTIDG